LRVGVWEVNDGEHGDQEADSPLMNLKTASAANIKFTVYHLADKYRMNMTSRVRAGRRGGRFKTAGSAIGVEWLFDKMQFMYR
jgi:hypothetical protein